MINELYSRLKEQEYEPEDAYKKVREFKVGDKAYLFLGDNSIGDEDDDAFQQKLIYSDSDGIVVAINRTKGGILYDLQFDDDVVIKGIESSELRHEGEKDVSDVYDFTGDTSILPSIDPPDNVIELLKILQSTDSDRSTIRSARQRIVNWMKRVLKEERTKWYDDYTLMIDSSLPGEYRYFLRRLFLGHMSTYDNYQLEDLVMKMNTKEWKDSDDPWDYF